MCVLYAARDAPSRPKEAVVCPVPLSGCERNMPVLPSGWTFVPTPTRPHRHEYRVGDKDVWSADSKTDALRFHKDLINEHGLPLAWHPSGSLFVDEDTGRRAKTKYDAWKVWKRHAKGSSEGLPPGWIAVKSHDSGRTMFYFDGDNTSNRPTMTARSKKEAWKKDTSSSLRVVHQTPSPSPTAPRTPPASHRVTHNSPEKTPPRGRRGGGHLSAAPVSCPLRRRPNVKRSRTSGSSLGTRRSGSRSRSPDPKYPTPDEVRGQALTLTKKILKGPGPSSSLPWTLYRDVVCRMRDEYGMRGKNTVVVCDGERGDAFAWAMACREASPTLKGVVGTDALDAHRAAKQDLSPKANAELKLAAQSDGLCYLSKDGQALSSYGCATHAIVTADSVHEYEKVINRALRADNLKALVVLLPIGTIRDSDVVVSNMVRIRRTTHADQVYVKWTRTATLKHVEKHWSDVAPPGLATIEGCVS